MNDEPAVLEEAVRIADALLGMQIDEAGRSYYYDTINEKRWVLGSGGRDGNCDECVEAVDDGWIPDDDVFDMFFEDVDGPPGHPNCDCELEYRERRIRIYT